MLNTTRVLEYIKSNLGFPFQQLELEDTEIVKHFTVYTLREFSMYFPQINKVHLPLNVEAYKVPGRQNEFYIQDPQGLEILGVIDIYFSTSEYYIHGHPPFGPFTHGEITDWATRVEMAGQVRSFSSFEHTFEFQHPNIVRISPVSTTDHSCTVEYERMQPADLRGVPNEFQIMFCDLALADIQIVLGRIRKKYGDGNLRTPFGEIPLGSDIFEEGKEKKRELIEKLMTSIPPNVVLDFA